MDMGQLDGMEEMRKRLEEKGGSLWLNEMDYQL
jgi:hypothetical protein